MPRKKKPANVKAMEGTHRANRDNPPTTHNPGELQAPAWLSKEGKTIFHRVADYCKGMGILSHTDSEALATFANEYAIYLKCQRVLHKHGLTSTEYDTNGQPRDRKRPEVEIANSKLRTIQSLMTEFALTPAARERISTVEQGIISAPALSALESNTRFFLFPFLS